jgi:hypothetical protein
MVIARIKALLATLVFMIALPAGVLAQAMPPHVFLGTATEGDAPVPDGTVVTAWVDGAQTSSATVSEGRYMLLVVAPEDVQYSGKTVSFKIGDAEANETATWEQGGADELDLTSSTVQPPQPDSETGAGQPGQDGEATGAGEPGQDGEAAGAGEPSQDGEADGAATRRRAFVGVVDDEPGATVTLIRKGTGERVTVRLDSYELRTPGGPVAGSFTAGARVVILAQRDGAEWAAMWVLVKPTGLRSQPVTGALVSVQDGVLTIMRRNGTTKTLKLGRGVVPPEVGEVVTGFGGPGDDGEAQDSESPQVTKGLVKAAKVRERLERFLQNLTTEDGGLPEAATRHRAQLVDDVAVILEGHADERVGILENLSRRDLPAQAAEGMRKALERNERDRSQARGKAAEARTKAGPPPGRGRGGGRR